MNKKFDYIIIGAGSAGCVLANRLSADGKQQVLLVEAGGKDWNPLIHMPAGLAKLVGIKSINWSYETEPETHMNMRQMYWPRGKVLGGSSSINAMCYCRGHRKDYDLWQDMGNEGWSYDEVLPYFKKAENNQRINNDIHGQDGPLWVSDLSYTNPLSQVFIDGAVECGFDQTDDFNGEHQRGFGFYQVTQKDNKRHSTAQAYLKPAQNRDNLTVMTKTACHKVLLEDGVVKGVVLAQGDNTFEVHADKEVILSGGAINSPQLLLLSGIGPKAELAAHEIECQHDLPGVGKNLQDHLDVCLVQRCKQKITYDTLNDITVGLKYYLFKKGPGTSNVAEAGGFWQSPLAKDDRPDLQFHFVPAMLDDHGRNRIKGSGYTIHMCVLRPESRGQITLHSADPKAHAKIEANYLSVPHDLELMVAGFKIQRQILASKAFDEFRDDELFPGSDVQTDEQIIEFIRQKSESIYHPIGTCKMGQDEMAVVDQKLKVHGLKGLRVVDASVMPTLVSGNTNAPTIMMAEKISDDILNQ
ncbi:GMC family oxidoreductase [Marinicella rhabdoformis]|uniref:GMC family oxidoreductase n=1 Tax=Marinicella rhabdoformis TaxID=2580566 RepID=UPI0012AEBAD7|nr:choline dehydrogenase [Marinicella rhabdoformis]